MVVDHQRHDPAHDRPEDDARADQGRSPGQSVGAAVRGGVGPWTTNHFVEAVYAQPDDETMKLLTSIVGLAAITAGPAAAGVCPGRPRSRSSRYFGQAKPGDGALRFRRATGCRSSPTTGASAWCRLRKATTRASRSPWRGKKTADAWGIRSKTKPPAISASTTAPRRSCISRTRLHITWQDDTTLRVDTDAGTQTRLFQFGKPAAAPGKRTWQGNSVAIWEARRANNQEKAEEIAEGHDDKHAGRLPAQKRRAVPGDSAVLTEYYDLFSGTRRYDDDVRHGGRAGSCIIWEQRYR